MFVKWIYQQKKRPVVRKWLCILNAIAAVSIEISFYCHQIRYAHFNFRDIELTVINSIGVQSFDVRMNGIFGTQSSDIFDAKDILLECDYSPTFTYASNIRRQKSKQLNKRLRVTRWVSECAYYSVHLSYWIISGYCCSLYGLFAKMRSLAPWCAFALTRLHIVRHSPQQQQHQMKWF